MYITLFSSVFIVDFECIPHSVDFEEVNVCWEVKRKNRKLKFFRPVDE